MAVEGKTILQTTERTELTGKEGIPFQEGVQNGHVLLEKIRRFVMDGLFETDQFGADIFVLPKGGKLVTWVDDAAQIPLVFYKEYDNGEKQVEVGSPQRHLNLNSPDMVTVELPGGKKEKLLTESQLGKATSEKDGLMSKEDKKVLDKMKDGGAIEYKEISGQTVDADDLIVPKLTVRYLNKNASTAGNISNIPAKGGFVLESMCVRYVDEDNCGYIQTYYSQNSDSRILPFSLTRQYTNGKWTEWRSTVGRYLCVNEAYEKVGTTFLGTGFQVGNIFDRSIVKDGALAISTQDVALHLTGVKNSTTYKVVGNASVGYWMMKNCPEQFFHAGKVAVSEDKTSESDETKKEYVAEVVSVDAEEGTVTFSKTLNPYTDFNDYSASFKAYAENGSLCLSAGTSTFLGIAGEECVAGAESADGCVALGDRCVSTGGCSVALCWQTVARNFAETALGMSNKSHKGDSADKQTLFSIGNGTQWFNDWGTAKQKNAVEVMKNGDMYIEGVGGYDGINDGFTAQSVQDVISGLLSEVSALKEEIEALKGSGA